MKHVFRLSPFEMVTLVGEHVIAKQRLTNPGGTWSIRLNYRDDYTEIELEPLPPSEPKP